MYWKYTVKGVAKMKRVLSVILIALFVMSFVTACGTSSGTTADKSTAAVTTPASSASGDAKKEETKKDEPAAPGIDITKAKGKLTMWSWDAWTLKMYKDQLAKVNPGLEFVTQSFDYNQLFQKLRTALQAGVGLPDICMVEFGVMPEFRDNPGFDDLSAPPYNSGELEKLYFQFAWDMTKGKDGKFRLLPSSPGMGATFYRRDLAKQYFGTDDPAELEKMMPTMDAAYEKGKELVKKSNGQAVMIDAARVIFDDLLQVQKKPLVDDNGKLQLEDTALQPLKTAVEWRKAGLDGKYQQWTPAWGASFTKGNVFMYISGSWFENYAIMANDKDKVSYGKWGVMATPGGTVNMGGNFLAIPKSNKNKELAWAVLKFIATQPDHAGAVQYMKEAACYPSLKDAVNDPIFDEALPLFNGQKARKRYAELATNLIFKQITPNDTAIMNLVNPKVDDAILGKITPEDAIKQAKEAVLKQLAGKVQ